MANVPVRGVDILSSCLFEENSICERQMVIFEWMGRRDKLLESITNGPNNVTFSQIRKLLELSGFALDRVSVSHHVFRRDSIIVPIPVHNNRVKTVYVKRVLELLNEGNQI